ncbi:hypothetical protein AVEN_168147-1 [Araneus ventricosus]|uniref:RNase H type-1 domain-containing protein n=1 Tax=Araneus ventricosus TaxID=182803 RepID=A0A4Y2CKQ4_ARAVE|nr:hypothetical protein AVEN_168147-1 [Araneus ventricosus]
MKPSDTLCNFGKKLTITNNRYECPLQWKSPKMRETLGNNFEVAKKRFANLEKRFNHDDSLFDRYNAVMKEQIQAGIIEMCSDECFIGYVMPHREVLRDSSSSTKTRIVYDASSKLDDLFYGSSTIQDAFILSSDAVSILKDANMNMRKFDTNSKELKNVWLNSNSDIETNEHSDNHLKVLGLVWNNLDDTLGIDLHSLLSKLNENECTKRNVLHTAAKLFDPSGFISPFLIRIKCLLQELWQLGIGWDEVFTGQIKENFQNWCKEIKDLQNLKIPRYYFPDQIVIDNQDTQLHIFSDASLKSFGAVAYLRYKTSKGKFQTSFVIWKSREAPIKKLTLPRLELMGAIIASRIVKHLKGIFKDIKKVFCLSDSTIVLHWIKGSASKYKQFVANRVIEIQETTDPISWKHCSGKHNPADLLTRGLASRDLITFIKWWHGPEWLRDVENLWPKVKEFKRIWNILNHPDVKNFYSYIVERAVWWGGFYEGMVRTVKTALRKTLGKSCLTVEQLLTVIIEIEGMINSRPITYVGNDTEEPTALTPAHFLLGKRITSLPSVRLRLDSNLSSRKCLIKSFNYRERLMRSFWTRWKNEYLLNLRSAHSSLVKNSSPFKVNDVILIKDDHLPRNFWKLGRIIELLPGRDGKVRVCKITSQSKFDVTLDGFASRLAAEFIIFMEFFSLILGVDQLAASRLQLDSRNLPEFL